MIREAGFMNLARHVNFPTHINSAMHSLDGGGNNDVWVALATLTCLAIPAAIFLYAISPKRLRRVYREDWERNKNRPPSSSEWDPESISP